MGKSKILWIFAVLGVVMSIASPASAASVSLKNDLKYSQVHEAFILGITHIKHADRQNEYSRPSIWPQRMHGAQTAHDQRPLHLFYEQANGGAGLWPGQRGSWISALFAARAGKYSARV